MFKQMLSLVFIAGSCGAILLTTQTMTQPAIQANRNTQASEIFSQLLGSRLPDRWQTSANLPTTDQLISQPRGNCEDWLFSADQQSGYAGNITLLALWRADRSLSLRVLSHRETPGIGDFIDHTRSTWITDLDGSVAEDIEQIDNVSGATITTAAIMRSMQQLFNKLEKHCELESG